MIERIFVENKSESKTKQLLDKNVPGIERDYPLSIITNKTFSFSIVHLLLIASEK